MLSKILPASVCALVLSANTAMAFPTKIPPVGIPPGGGIPRPRPRWGRRLLGWFRRQGLGSCSSDGVVAQHSEARSRNEQRAAGRKAARAE